MSNLNKIPGEFRVLSTQPELRIRYHSRIWLKALMLLMFLPFFFVFLGHMWIILFAFYEMVHFRIWQGINLFSYDTGNPWFFLIFLFTFGLLSVVCWAALWALLGVTEIDAKSDSLTISYRLLGISRKTSFLTRDIRYFNQFLDKSSEGNSYHVEVVTNQRLFNEDRTLPAWFPAKWISADMSTRMNYKTINLYGHPNSKPSEWLGRILADFYRVEFKSIATK